MRFFFTMGIIRQTFYRNDKSFAVLTEKRYMEECDFLFFTMVPKEDDKDGVCVEVPSYEYAQEWLAKNHYTQIRPLREGKLSEFEVHGTEEKE